MLRCFAQAACDALFLKFGVGVSAPCDEKAAFGLVGHSSDVPFTPLERKVTTRVAAAQKRMMQKLISRPGLCQMKLSLKPRLMKPFDSLQSVGGATH